MEDQVLGQGLGVAPDRPADARVDEAVLVPGRVDRRDARQAEVPFEVGVDERRDEPAGGAVDVQRDVEAGALLEVVERSRDLRNRLVRAVEGRSEDGDDPDRVLVAERHRLLAVQREAVALHRDEAHLDVPVVRELLPAHLDVDAHDDVWLVGGLAGGAAGLVPAALQRQAGEHRRLARARGRAPGPDVRLRRVPEVGQDVHAAHLERRRLRVLVLVDHVLVERVLHERARLRLHPRGHERRQVQLRVAVEHELVADCLLGRVGWDTGRQERVPRQPVQLEIDDRGRLQQGHRSSPVGVRGAGLPGAPRTC